MKRPCLNNHLITKKHDYFNMVSSPDKSGQAM
jgi:hypothetical protein